MVGGSGRMGYILGPLVEEWKARQRLKAAQYGDDNHAALGERGQFADIWRKIGPLKRALWEGEDTEGWAEQPREILMDLIGHCFLTIELMDRADPTRTVAPEPMSPDDLGRLIAAQDALRAPRFSPTGRISFTDGGGRFRIGIQSATCRIETEKAELVSQTHRHDIRCIQDSG